MSTAKPTDRTRVRRMPSRGHYDSETIHAIIDEAPICQVAIVDDDRPVVIPMLHGRIAGTLYLHGSHSSRIMKRLAEGGDTCISFMLLDGLVLARTALHHSLNYRSVVMFGQGRPVEEDEEKRAALRSLVEHALPGRMEELSGLPDQDVAATAVVAVEISEASAKIRSGGTGEDDAPPDSAIWAGIVPLALVPLPIIPESNLALGIEMPASVRRIRSMARYTAAAGAASR